MLYLLLADLLVLLHLTFVVFVVLGILLVLRWPRLAWVHLPSALWGALIEFAGWVCPLTPLENRFRQLGGDAGYSGDFVEHYLLPILYPQALTRQTQIALGMLVLILNATGYVILWRRHTSGPG
ncbi:DUF2784 domain-containing protein [Candidatus Methylomirabilis sp.]|uniref:DUF2784 domain-containing protein n=1 Tax=Candidatus Methylomirabilis tolerans TaxID=3123416 RepID=A0AAJ1AIN2_9BACT|nr:DUF2784 domain-containing protein [Candidatus Methylomirabilis sp.]